MQVAQTLCTLRQTAWYLGNDVRPNCRELQARLQAFQVRTRKLSDDVDDVGHVSNAKLIRTQGGRWESSRHALPPTEQGVLFMDVALPSTVMAV
jgi:hypothetical protein